MRALAQQRERRIPARRAAGLHPAPVGVLRQQHQGRHVQRAGEMRHRGVDGDQHVELQQHQTGADPALAREVRAEVADQVAGAEQVDVARAGPDLQRIELDARILAERQQQLERDRPLGVAGVRRVAGPDDADLEARQVRLRQPRRRENVARPDAVAQQPRVGQDAIGAGAQQPGSEAR